ncbi:transglycosylase domain-containing protein [Candidatus Odyssella thessalonicensis]|uniref:transglycosylase domain-containing protein n=1 Tax=Candidatus Odyssella thessalonicensis TaxID=84647 RepID=UPI00111237CC|nr:PBP1A family penicillin-binding protein [Candidatus Odyssella thessalonicensis]
MADRPPILYAPKKASAKTSKSKKSKSFLSWLSFSLPKFSLGKLFKRKKSPDKKPKRKGSGRTTIRWMLFKLFLTLGVWIFSFGVLAILWFSYDLPDTDQLMVSSRKPGVTIQAWDGTIVGTYGDLFEEMVKLNDLPTHVPQALMSIEDRRFYGHFGVDVIGLIRAAYTNYRAGRVVQGGSTITQQLAKNFLQNQGKYSVHDRSLRRKIQEVILAVWLEMKFTKDQIMTMYLNRVYFGAGTFGIEAASQKYFHKPAKHLTVYEAAVIAGLLKAPSRYSPKSNPTRSHERALVVLNQMQEAGYIKSVEIALQQKHDEAQEETIDIKSGNFFGDWVYDQIPSLIGSYDEDLVVVTTLDPFMQHQAEVATKAKMDELAQKYKTSEISLVAMTPDGAVRAMIGGTHYGKSQYNRATQALRQPGSSFKPFVYLAGLESGLTPSTIISDEPFSHGGWTPGNFRTYHSVGAITMAEALKKSVNTVTARIAAQVGGPKIASVARRLGITSEMITDLSICLGTTEVTLLELTGAYASFANKGNFVSPYGILEIRNKKGDILYQHQAPDPIQVIKPHYLNQMNQMMMAVIEGGTGRAAKTDYPTAGKTGSNGDKDAWFIGFTTNLVVGIWTGNDNNAPMIKNSTGGRLPAQTFALFMKPVLEANPPSGSLLISGVHSPATAEEEEESDIIRESEIESTTFTEEPLDSASFDKLMEEAALE